jgi:hypothetical protein
MVDYNRPTFVNETVEEVKEKVKPVPNVSASLEDAIAIMNSNLSPDRVGNKVQVLSRTHRASVNNLSVRDKVQVKTIGNNLIYLVDKFETLWRAKRKIEWDSELYGLMASMLDEVHRQVEESKIDHRWVTPFKSRKVQNG